MKYKVMNDLPSNSPPELNANSHSQSQDHPVPFQLVEQIQFLEKKKVGSIVNFQVNTHLSLTHQFVRNGFRRSRSTFNA
jgi:hypothetical protein